MMIFKYTLASVAFLSVLFFFTLFLSPASAIEGDTLWAQWGIEISILPQSPLYPIKLYWEDIRLFLASKSTEGRAVLLLSFCNQRLGEIYKQIVPVVETGEIEESRVFITPELFATLERYHCQMEQLNQLLPFMEVGGNELAQLWNKHDDRKVELENILERHGAELGFVWKKEILEFLGLTTVVRPEKVLGSKRHVGLELYRLGEKTFDL